MARGKGNAMDLSFVTADAFAPHLDPWVPVGPISSVTEKSGDFLLTLRDEALAIRLSVLSATCLRVRFSPRADADYATETSSAVIDRDLGPVDVRATESTSQRLTIDTGAIRIEVDRQPY
jgi:alpha-glucosidase